MHETFLYSILRNIQDICLCADVAQLVEQLIRNQ